MAFDLTKFQKFQNTHQRLEDRITVTSTYSFGFPTKFYHDQKIDQFRFAVLYFEPSQLAVAIYFTSNEQEPHKFRIVKTSKGMGGSINATSFFKVYDLDPKDYHGRYEWTKDEMPGVGPVYIIQLKKRIPKLEPDTTIPQTQKPTEPLPTANPVSQPSGLPQQPTNPIQNSTPSESGRGA